MPFFKKKKKQNKKHIKTSVLKFNDTISTKTKRFSSELKMQERQQIGYMSDLIIEQEQYWHLKFRFQATYFGLPIMVHTFNLNFTFLTFEDYLLLFSFIRVGLNYHN